MRVTRALLVAAALVLALRPDRASADSAHREARVAVIVGADRGNETDVPLRYAELDAVRMRDLLTELGDVASGRAILVRGRDPGGVREALREASGRAAELRNAGYRVTFLFYYSGHGDQDSLHLPGGRIVLADLRQAISSIAADVRLTILDSCRGLGRTKGVNKGEEFQVSVVQRGPRGSAEVRASSDGEAAQESDELRGSVFTHFLISGLRGDADADGDRRVTLAELYAYAYRRTLLRTQTGPVTQHATLDVDLEGAGELVVAVPGAAAATLVVPPGDLRYLVVATPSAAVIGEITSAGGAFALPAGKYLVLVRDGKRTRVAHVDLSGGGTKRLAIGEFREVSREHLVARGGWLELQRSRLRLATGAELAASGAEQPALHASVGYARVRGPWLWEFALGGGWGGLDSGQWSGMSRTLSATAIAGRRWRVSALEVVVGAGPEVRYGWQTLEARNPRWIESLGLPTTARFHYGAGGLRGVARIELPVGADARISLELAALAAMRRETAVDGSGAHLESLFLVTPSAAYVHAF